MAAGPKTTIDGAILEQAIALYSLNASVYERYVGRGMGDEPCVGIRFDNWRTYAWLWMALPEVDEHDGKLARQMAARLEVDQVGREWIVYFPGFVLGAGGI